MGAMDNALSLAYQICLLQELLVDAQAACNLYEQAMKAAEAPNPQKSRHKNARKT
jgi:hypothetical protein